MKAAIMLAPLFLAIGAASQTAVQSPTQAQCRFSDGSTITVTYSPDLRQFRLSTDGPLLVAKEWNLPSGDYTVHLEEDSHHRWSLLMRKPIKRNGDTVNFFLSFPLSMSTSALLSEQPKISFDQTGGGCVMHLQENPDTILSLEFAKRGLELASLAVAP